MPIIDKINIAKKKYAEKLDEFRRAAGGEFDEKELIAMLADMIGIRTEIDILTKVENHRRQS